ncbi:hypothetical protein Ancab_031365 [Ancistrocladus abbreviatus]
MGLAREEFTHSSNLLKGINQNHPWFPSLAGLSFLNRPVPLSQSHSKKRGKDGDGFDWYARMPRCLDDMSF